MTALWELGRPWSLWEMLEFSAKSFYEASIAMAGTTQLIETHYANIESADGSLVMKAINSPEIREGYLNHAEVLRDSCADLGAEVTLDAVQRLIIELRGDGPVFYADIAQRYRDIISRFRDELTRVKAFSLSRDEQKFYSPDKPLFSEKFELKFPNAAREVDEAGKCLALGRPTAAVFHLMRAMEIGIRSLARCLGITDPVKPAERNWAVILGEVNKGIEARWPTAAARMHGDGSLFESLRASLDAVKNPWRNSTMHIEKTYTDDQAKHIFLAVKGFMNEMASRMDEEGNPKA